MPTALRLLPALSPEHRERLMSVAREVSFPADGPIFEAGGTADRFWVVRSGTVSLYQRVLAERRITVAQLGPGDLLGWSWLFRPHTWDFGAEAFSPVRAYEFDASAVMETCGKDLVLNLALYAYVAGVIADRLRATRIRLLDLYAPYGAGPVP